MTGAARIVEVDLMQSGDTLLRALGGVVIPLRGGGAGSLDPLDVGWWRRRGERR